MSSVDEASRMIRGAFILKWILTCELVSRAARPEPLWLADVARSWESPTRGCHSPPAYWRRRQAAQPWRKLKLPQQKQRLAARLGAHVLARAELPAPQQEQSRK